MAADPSELERIALDDTSTVSVEGAFVDRIEEIAEQALDELRAHYKQQGVAQADLNRMHTLLHEDVQHANDAARVLVVAGDAMLPMLREALLHARADVRLKACRALIRLNHADDAVALLNDPDSGVRAAIASAWPPGKATWCDKLAGQLQLEPLAKVRLAMVQSLSYSQTNDSARALLSCAADTDADVRARAAHCLHTFRWEPARHDLPLLATLATDWLRFEPEAGICASLLGNAPLLPHAPNALPLLLALSQAEGAKLRSGACRCLGSATGDGAGAAANALVGCVHDVDEVAIVALVSLAELGDARARDLIAERLAKGRLNTSPRERLEQACRRIPDNAKPLPEFTMLAEQPLVMQRAQFAPALSEAEREAIAQAADPERTRRETALQHRPRAGRGLWWLNVLIERLRIEPTIALRAQIVDLIHRLAIPETINGYAVAMQDASEVVRAAAARRLRFGGEPAARLVAQHLVTETAPSVRHWLLDNDHVLMYVPDALPHFLSLCKHGDPRERALAAAQLKHLREAAPEHLMPLLDDPDIDVREAVIRALEGTASVAALPALNAVLANPAAARLHTATRKTIAWIQWRATHDRPSHWNP